MWEMINNLSQSIPTGELIIALVFLVAVFIFGVVIGRDKIVSVLVAIYVAFGIKSMLPSEWLNYLPFDRWLAELIVFVVILLVVFVVLTLSSTIRAGGPKGLVLRWIQAVLFACLSVGLLASIILPILPEDLLGGLTELARGLFLSPAARLGWFAAPVVAMLATKGGKKGPGRPVG